MQVTKVPLKIRSRDGTAIADHVSGEGPPLVLVHGSAADHTDWVLVQRHLEDHFEVHAMDRRGRGASGDADTWTLEREVEDVLAVLEALPAPARLAAHSLGALIALEAALRTDRVTALALYEPPLFLDNERPFALADHLDEVLATGDHDRVAEEFLRNLGDVPEEELAAMRAEPAVWGIIRESAPTLPREIRGASHHAFDPARVGKMRPPVLLLTGGDSEGFYRNAIATLHGTLPESRVEILQGQQHNALLDAPERVADALTRFFSGTTEGKT